MLALAGRKTYIADSCWVAVLDPNCEARDSRRFVLLFDPAIDTDQIPHVVQRLVELGTWKAWSGRFQSINDQIKANPLMERHLLDWYEIECALQRALNYKKSTGRFPRITSADKAMHRMFGFAAALTKVHEYLSPKGANTLESKVRGYLTDRYQSLASLAFEMAVIVNLMHRKVEVFCNDLEGGERFGGEGTYDFLARAKGLEVEIECKVFSADIGRKIHKRRHYELSGRVRSAMSQALADKGSFFMDVVLPDGMTESSEVESVASVLARALEARSEVKGPYEVNFLPVNLKNSPFDPRGGVFAMPSEDQVSEFIRTNFGHSNKNVFTQGDPDSGFAFLLVRSRKSDAVAEYIVRNLKDGAKQLSGKLPGIVCAHMLDMSSSELLELRDPAKGQGMRTEFERTMQEFFGPESRRHVYATRFSAPGYIKHDAKGSEHLFARTFQESGSTFHLVNASHQLRDDPRMSLFL